MKARGLVDLRPRDLACQRLVADLIAKAANHRRDLGVEERLRDHAGEGVEDLEILSRRMEHLHRAAVGEQLEERREVEIGAQRVDQHGALVTLARAGELNQAELRVIGALAQELGIDGDVGIVRGFGTEPGESVGRGDRRHGRHAP